MKIGRSDAAFPSFWQVQISGWLGFTLLVMLALLPYHDPNEFIDNAIWCVLVFFASWAMRPICRRLVRLQSWIVMQLYAFAASLVMGTLGAFVFEALLMLRDNLGWRDFFINVLQFTIVLFLWCTLYFSIAARQRASAERERLLRVESESREARLRSLRYQLNPHFLFNALNAVSTLILAGDAQAASRMLEQISLLLRNALEGDALTEVPLAIEIGLARQYLAIEETRFGERLRVAWDIAPETLDAQIPSMLLQPLLENAVRHGVAHVRESALIAVHSARRDGRLAITVTNPAPHVESAAEDRGRPGVGLDNTAERLRSLYGDDQRLTLVRSGATVSVTVEIPCA
jgi:two-component system, LytTR family, sensor kinase